MINNKEDYNVISYNIQKIIYFKCGNYYINFRNLKVT